MHACGTNAVVFSHGGQGYAKQALLSAASVLAQSPQCPVAVYTDCPEFFSSIPAIAHSLSQTELAGMLGPLQFRHRVKIQILLKHAAKVPESQSLLYLDADTYCTQPLESRLGAEALMHNFDGHVGPNFHTRFHKFVRTHRKLFIAAGYGDFPENLPMFNAGLIHLPPGVNRQKTLREVLQLTDFLCLWFPQQMEWLEQAAFCWCLPRFYQLRADNCGVLHYWRTNQEVSAELDRLSRDEIVALGANREAFDRILASSPQLQKRELYRWQLRLAKLGRSCKKRALFLRAVQLRLRHGARPSWA